MRRLVLRGGASALDRRRWREKISDIGPAGSGEWVPRLWEGEGGTALWGMDHLVIPSEGRELQICAWRRASC